MNGGYVGWRSEAKLVPRKGYVFPSPEESVADAIQLYTERFKAAPKEVLVGTPDMRLDGTCISGIPIRCEARIPLNEYHAGPVEK